MARRDFQTIGDLADWLAAMGISTSEWERGGAKSLVDLWAEYGNGEAVLSDDPPSRTIEVAQVIIRRGDSVLIEIEQEFEDGRRRARMWPPSEKMKSGEAPRQAAQRCLSEELGLGEGEIALGEEVDLIEELADSPSYPGLPTRYQFHVFPARLVAADALPAADFHRDNHAVDDPIRRHYWGWRTAKENPQISQIKS
jgi:hypothetical protein